MTPATDRASLTIFRTFAAPRELVFAAWTDPEHLKKWFGPEMCSATDAELDLRVGGSFRVRMEGPGGKEYIVRGHYREITSPSRLVYTWHWDNNPELTDSESLVTIDFLERGNSTEVRLTHGNLPTQQSAAAHTQGWSGSLEKLARFLGA